MGKKKRAVKAALDAKHEAQRLNRARLQAAGIVRK